jgi:hypothetical protein
MTPEAGLSSANEGDRMPVYDKRECAAHWHLTERVTALAASAYWAGVKDAVGDNKVLGPLFTTADKPVPGWVELGAREVASQQYEPCGRELVVQIPYPCNGQALTLLMRDLGGTLGFRNLSFVMGSTWIQVWALPPNHVGHVPPPLAEQPPNTPGSAAAEEGAE